MIHGMDMLLKKINIHPDDKTFTIEELISLSNDVYSEILNTPDPDKS